MSARPSSFLNKKQSNRVKILVSRHNPNGGTARKALYIDNVFYESILEASEQAGLSRRIVRERCNSKESRFDNYCFAANYKSSSKEE